VARRGIFTIVICLFLAAAVGSRADAASMALRAGLGYDFLSQRYFLDSVSLDPADSAYTEFALKSTYLDALKGQVSASVYPLDNRNLELQGSLEQSADYLRLKLNSNWDLRPGRSKIDIDNEFEWRNRFDATEQFGDSYLFGNSRVRATVPFSGTYSLISQGKVEGVDFRTAASSAFDYVRVYGKLGIEKSFANYSFTDLSFLVSAREVPDSTVMNYGSYGAEASFFGFLPIGNLDLYARYEFKNYNRPDNQDDQNRVEFYAHNRVALSEDWFSRQDADLEGVVYRVRDEINADYARVGWTLLAGRQIGDLSLAAGPDFELLTEKRQVDSSLSFYGEDYFESGLRIDADYMSVGGIFASLESTTGYRDLEYENVFQTGFMFERIYLIGNIKVFSVLNLSVLFSAEWEWHSQKTDNSALYLLSSSLNYSF